MTLASFGFRAKSAGRQPDPDEEPVLMAKKRIPQTLKHSAEFVRFEFRFWLDAGRVSTLGDLLRLLQEVEEEMMGFNGEDIIVDHWDELGVTTDYINLWGDLDEADSEDRLTFS